MRVIRIYEFAMDVVAARKFNSVKLNHFLPLHFKSSGEKLYALCRRNENAGVGRNWARK